MALRDQPYLPLYVDDFMVDEKLRECSAESTGVYIRLMCLMHKSEEYGVILLKQKDKQNHSTCLNFANKLAMHLPYSIAVIERSLNELVSNGVIQMDDDKILQKRMVRDFHISSIRAKAGKTGGDNASLARGFALAKTQANSENEYDIDDKGVIGGEQESRVPYSKIQELWNKTVTLLPKIERITDGRRKAIKARFADGGYDLFVEVFRMVEESDFLSGRNGKWATGGCGFDWVIKQSNWAKIIEGNYKNKQISLQEGMMPNGRPLPTRENPKPT